MTCSLSNDEKLVIARRFAAATRTNDAAAHRALCTPEAYTWHNFDEVKVDTDKTLRTLAWLHRTVPDLQWHDVALHATPSGFVSQTIMTGTAPGGALRAHSCLVVTLNDDGLVTAADEYLDPAQLAVLSG